MTATWICLLSMRSCSTLRYSVVTLYFDAIADEILGPTAIVNRQVSTTATRIPSIPVDRAAAPFYTFGARSWTPLSHKTSSPVGIRV